MKPIVIFLDSNIIINALLHKKFEIENGNRKKKKSYIDFLGLLTEYEDFFVVTSFINTFEAYKFLISFHFFRILYKHAIKTKQYEIIDDAIKNYKKVELLKEILEKHLQWHEKKHKKFINMIKRRMLEVLDFITDEEIYLSSLIKSSENSTNKENTKVLDEIITFALKLFHEYNIHWEDALILALAEKYGVDYFVTSDNYLLKLREKLPLSFKIVRIEELYKEILKKKPEMKEFFEVDSLK